MLKRLIKSEALILMLSTIPTILYAILKNDVEVTKTVVVVMLNAILTTLLGLRLEQIRLSNNVTAEKKDDDRTTED